MNYEIIATLGPGSSEPTQWESMLTAGATAFRLNTSHLTLRQTLKWLEKLEAMFHTSGSSVPVVLDLQGSKWRLGKLPVANLKSGQQIELRQAASSDQSIIFPVPHKDFFLAAAASDGEIILNDAKLRLQIEKIDKESITARVTQAGPIAANKGITLASQQLPPRRPEPERQDHLYANRVLSSLSATPFPTSKMPTKWKPTEINWAAHPT